MQDFIIMIMITMYYDQEIRPYETKAIGRANFFGRMETNHTSFIRIKTMHVSSPSIVLPVEVEVSESPSLFLSREILDFGILKSGGIFSIFWYRLCLVN